MGFSVLFGILIAGPTTGASLNPARVFGPSVISGKADERGMFIYYLGPVIGGMLAWLFKLVLFADENLKELQ